MTLGLLSNITLFLLSTVLLSSTMSSAQLNVKYGAAGLDQLTYAGSVLEDTTRFRDDTFHIGHMKVTDRSGNPITAEGWGENNQGRSWDAATKTWIYQFRWGSIRTQYVQRGNSLDIVVTETNRAGSGVVLAGASVYPLVLHFPGLPKGFSNAAYPQGGSNAIGPVVVAANFGTAQLVSVLADVSRPVYSFLWPVNNTTLTYAALLSSTPPDGLAEFQPHHDRPVQPGQTDSLRLSLRFAPSGTSIKTLAADAYAQWNAKWPMQLHWPDRRVIGTAYLATSPAPASIQLVGPGANPRRYFANREANGIDIRTPEGLKRFQATVLSSAQEITHNLRKLNAQGVITWDIEGEEYPHATSYVCSPDQIATEAPEMESTVLDSHSPYAGQKLDDAYFRIIREAGFKTGVCIRPQRFIKSSDGSAHQTHLVVKEAEAELLRKIRYAHDRWGATIFYIDSTVEADGASMDAGIFQRLAAVFPDSLLIPEESSSKHYAYTAPFKTFLFHNDLGTAPAVHDYYPTAFSCNLINDVSPATLATFTPELVEQVASGDILMVHADYWDPNNTRTIAIYEQAARMKTNR